MTSRGAYRSRQVWQVLSARPLTDEERRAAADILSDQQMALFVGQAEAGQQHGLRVMKTLMDAGHKQHDLLVAALLHDVGKNRVRYTWLDRVKVVLAQRFAPGLAKKWATGSDSGWTRAFVVKERHPEWGAEALAAAGGSVLSVDLVRRHQEKLSASLDENEENRLLALLQWSDDQN